MIASVHLTMLEIVSRLQKLELPDIDLILGIASGGIVPASMLSYKLQKPMQLIHINFRDADNKPKFQQPQLITNFHLQPVYQRILIVDDVSVTGSTLQVVKNLLSDRQVRTFTLKGKADYVLFPEVTSCVTWPWKAK